MPDVAKVSLPDPATAVDWLLALEAAVQAADGPWILLEQGGPAPPSLVAALRSAAGAGEVAVVGVTVSDTIKEVRDGIVRRTVAREMLRDLRGPWLWPRDQLLIIVARARREQWTSASVLDLCRQAGIPVRVTGATAS